VRGVVKSFADKDKITCELVYVYVIKHTHTHIYIYTHTYIHIHIDRQSDNLRLTQQLLPRMDGASRN